MDIVGIICIFNKIHFIVLRRIFVIKLIIILKICKRLSKKRTYH